MKRVWTSSVWLQMGMVKSEIFFTDQFSMQESTASSEMFTHPDLDFAAFIDKSFEQPLPAFPLPDVIHIWKKWRNQILNVKRLLIIGSHTIQLEPLQKSWDE